MATTSASYAAGRGFDSLPYSSAPELTSSLAEYKCLVVSPTPLGMITVNPAGEKFCSSKGLADAVTDVQ